MKPDEIGRWAGWAVVASSLLYIATDAGEAIGGTSGPALLWATYAAFLVLPFGMLGLHAAGVGGRTRASLLGAVLYGGSFVYFSGVTLVATVQGADDYAALASSLSPGYQISGAVMVLGGALFADAARRAGVVPLWAAVMLLAGSAISVPIALLPIDPNWQSLANLLRSMGLIGMGLTLIGRRED